MALALAGPIPAASQTPSARRPQAPAAAHSAPLSGLDAYITQAMRDWDVPGLAIAVVKDDSVVYAKGFGVRELGKPDAVSVNTVFIAASTTKTFTAALMAMLVDSGRVRWNAPVTTYLPGFQLYDPFVTRELMVRDLLSHRSGLGRADALWYGSTYSRDEILRRLRFERPSWSLRAQYGYNNNMFIAAGQVIAAVTGRPWDDVVRERIFQPLGMTRTTTSVTALRGMDDVATPHARYDGRMTPIGWRNFDNVGSAGAINTTVRDMAQWVRFQLSRGSYGGSRLLSDSAFRQMRLPNTPIRPDASADTLWPEVHLRAYGLGWVLNDYRGRLVVSHGGALDGMRAQVGLLPEERLGVVVMANSDQVGSLLVGLQYRVFDAYTGGVRRDWSADLLADVRKGREREARDSVKTDSTRVRGTQPSHPLAQFAGRYVYSLYGEMTVAEEGGRLVLRSGTWAIADLEHWHYDTFRAVWHDREFGSDFATFATDADGKVSKV
ncbi:MAG: serine hydrolase, partial [Deltaproteobacteria bacterium]|nr:serine hydrolase [Deltaproteobacteria bacterium]